LYKNHITYNSTTGNFTTGGPNAGHSAWLFDAAGNITQTGDMIVAVSYSSGAPTVEVRIWISRTTYNNVTPNLFNFGSSFDGSTTSFGYASIVSKTGATAFGSGIANFSAVPAADTTYSTPWGARNTSGWSSQYSSLQFIEVGLNLTRIGIDPALYASVLNSGACGSSFASIFFKSRSSASFTSNLQDFSGPFDFLQTPVLDYTLSAPVLSCANSTGNISVTNNTTAGFYTWTTSNGNITSTTSNGIQVNKPGSYTLQAAVADGCPVVKTDVVTVAADTFPPVASFYMTSSADLSHYVLHGGSLSASNYSTPFGGSQGLLWNWSGPGGFSATIQTPQADTIKGTYQLIVTEKRNGCTDTAYNVMNLTVLSEQTGSGTTPRRPQDVPSFYLAGNNFTGKVRLVVNTSTADKATVAIYSTLGQVVYSKNIALQKGQNNIELPVSEYGHYKLQVVALYVNNKLRFTQKAIF